MNTQTQTKKDSPYSLAVMEIKRYDNQIAQMLPRHIPSEKFQRTLIGALSNQPDVAQAAVATPAGKANLIREVMKAASDGVVLDGREAVLTTFTRKKKKAKRTDPDEFYKEIKYMPMVQGVLKRLRNSGQIKSIECNVVYSNDFFDVEFGDESYLKHRPWYVNDQSEPGDLKFAYVSVMLNDGQRVREVMTRYDMLKVMTASRSKDAAGNVVGPWKDWPEEMWRKAVLHRGSKYLPKSSDKETGQSVTELLERDNDLYADVSADVDEGEVIDEKTGEVTGGEKTPAPKAEEPRGRSRQAKPKDDEKSDPPAPRQSPPPASNGNGERRSAADVLNGQPEDPDDDDGRGGGDPADDDLI